VYDKEKLCERERGCACECVHAKMSVRVCLCLCVSMCERERERERCVCEREKERKKGGRVWGRGQPRGVGVREIECVCYTQSIEVCPANPSRPNVVLARLLDTYQEWRNCTIVGHETLICSHLCFTKTE